MGFIDGWLDKMKLNEYDDEDDDYDYDGDSGYDEEDDDIVSNVRTRRTVKPAKETAPKKTSDDYIKERDSRPKAEPKPVSRPTKVVKQQPKQNSRVVSMQGKINPMEVCVIKPTNVEDGREIAETLLSGRAVILNLEGLDVELAQRIIDFTSGACFAIDGKLKKVSNYIFIATPSSISISGDLTELLSSEVSSSVFSGQNFDF